MAKTIFVSHQQVLQHLPSMCQQPPDYIERIILMLTDISLCQHTYFLTSSWFR